MSIRAVATGVGRHINGGNHIQAHFIAYNLRQLRDGQLVDKRVPLWIVKRDIFHINKADPIVLLVLIGGDIRCVCRLFILEVFHEIFDLVGSR